MVRLFPRRVLQPPVSRAAVSVRAAPLAALCFGLLAVGCGNKKGEESVEACEAWLTTMVCGETDYRSEFDCAVYGEQRCDVTPYFTCLTAKTECDEEASEFDFTGWDDCAVVAGCAE